MEFQLGDFCRFGRFTIALRGSRTLRCLGFVGWFLEELFVPFGIDGNSQVHAPSLHAPRIAFARSAPPLNLIQYLLNHADNVFHFVRKLDGNFTLEALWPKCSEAGAIRPTPEVRSLAGKLRGEMENNETRLSGCATQKKTCDQKKTLRTGSPGKLFNRPLRRGPCPITSRASASILGPGLLLTILPISSSRHF